MIGFHMVGLKSQSDLSGVVESQLKILNFPKILEIFGCDSTTPLKSDCDLKPTK
jgi:hypothetical protein